MSILGKCMESLRTCKDYRDKRRLWESKMKPVWEYLQHTNVPELTIDEKREIDNYWRQYGIKYRDYSWFRWFYYVTGEKNPCFIPNDVYAYVIWPYYDNEGFRHAWKDKNFFERFLPDVNFPDVIMQKIHGRFYFDNVYTRPEEALDKLTALNENVIVKDAWDTGEGRGVTKYDLSKTGEAERLLSEWNSDNYLVQRNIKQHPFFARFNESSVNVMRISSWYHDGKVEILAPTLRVGLPGKCTDVCYCDGVETVHVIGITNDGYLKDYIVNQFGEKEPIENRIRKSERKIPCWNEIVNIIKNNHLLLQHFDIIGWDFIVSGGGKIVCIEYNVQRPGTVFYQYVNGPFFGEYTDEVLSFLKKDENKYKYVPAWLSCK